MHVVVIGAGAAGLMAAGRAAELGAQVTLLEKTDNPAKKLLISGQSRCNLTNDAPLDDFLAMYGPNGRFLRGPFSRFFREELLQLLGRHGLEAKLERGGRIFPASDDARDVVQALRAYAEGHGARLCLGAKVTSILREGGRVSGVGLEHEVVAADAVILATGGSSWPGTGSTGDGYRLARKLGHTVTPLCPALVPLAVHQVGLALAMQGVSLRNVRLTALRGPSTAIDPRALPSADVGGRGLDRKRARPPVIESRLGEMLITHFGIGGPITLLMSLAVVQALEAGPVSVAIDLKPALAWEQLHMRVQREVEVRPQRALRGLMESLLPQKMVQPMAQLTGIDLTARSHTLTAVQRGHLVQMLKALRFDVDRALPLSRAIVTAGGVAIKEVDPRTMESRLVPGLFLAGEVLDLDGDTGGYNLQAAFSTGYIAGEAAAS